ncbi:hypothetical protein N7467_004735 [Penicillium canescens]|nr:hypothetical protein N7467_004735 [Penicillium canescens]
MRKDRDLLIMEVNRESETEQISILRETGWVFAEDQAAECLFGVYAAKPGTTDDDVVDFKNLVIELENLD